MPHKHRRQGHPGKDSSLFDLPPTAIARPLLVKPSKAESVNKKTTSQRRQSAEKPYDGDDTPRDWTRLMRFQSVRHRPRSGLDDKANEGVKRGKKRKRAIEDTQKTETVNENRSSTAQLGGTLAVPRIMPGERLSSFAARVDAALPVAGLKSKGNKALDRSLGLKGEKVTKTERRMQRMQREWREEEARRRERRQEQAEEMEEDEDWIEKVELGKMLQEATGHGRRKKRARRSNGLTHDDEDPWAAVKKARGDEGRQKTVTDVVQSPPKLAAVRERFKIRASGNDPGGSIGVEAMDVPTKSSAVRYDEEKNYGR